MPCLCLGGSERNPQKVPNTSKENRHLSDTAQILRSISIVRSLYSYVDLNTPSPLISSSLDSVCTSEDRPPHVLQQARAPPPTRRTHRATDKRPCVSKALHTGWHRDGRVSSGDSTTDRPHDRPTAPARSSCAQRCCSRRCPRQGITLVHFSAQPESLLSLIETV